MCAGVLKLEGREWDQVHDSAKNLLQHMLKVEADERWTAGQLLQHPWFEEVLTGEERPLPEDYMARIHSYVGMSRMKRLSMKLLAHGVRKREMEHLKVRSSVHGGAAWDAARAVTRPPPARCEVPRSTRQCLKHCQQDPQPCPAADLLCHHPS